MGDNGLVHHALFVLVAVVTIGVAPAAASAAKQQAMALVGVQCQPAAPTCDALQSDMRAAMATNPSVALQANDVTMRLLADADQLAAPCDVSLDQCLLDAASLTGVDVAVHGRWQGNSATMRAAILSTGIVRAVTWVVPPTNQALQVLLLREQIIALLFPGTVGTLLIEAPVGAAVWVDGEPRGASPLALLVGQTPGEHVVEIKFAEGSERTGLVEVKAGAGTRAAAVPVPGLAAALVWVGVGVTGAALIPAAVGGVFAVVYGNARGSLAAQDTNFRFDYRAGDLNDRATRGAAIAAQKDLHDSLPLSVGGFALAGAVAAVGIAAWVGGVMWRDTGGWVVHGVE